MKAICVLFALALLGGCGQSPNTALPQSPLAQSRAHKASGSEHQYLYVAENDNGTDRTEVRSLPDGNKVGIIANFGRMCEDAVGNVYMTYGPSVTEYPPGSTTASAQATLPANVMGEDCAIDPSSGDIAVAGYLSRKQSQYKSWLGIYRNLSARPTVYSDKRMGTFTNCGYDGSGNLFLTGFPGIAIELLKNTKKVVTFSNPNYLTYGSFRWDGSYLTVERPKLQKKPVAILRLTVSGSMVTLVGETDLDVHAGYSWLQGDTVAKIASHNNLPAGRSKMGLWHYPQGGVHPYMTFKGFDLVFYPLIDVSYGK
jgi:hypothetical protein